MQQERATLLDTIERRGALRWLALANLATYAQTPGVTAEQVRRARVETQRAIDALEGRS